MSYEIEFADAIRAAGLTPPPEIIADGKLHRFSASGKPRDLSGWFVLHPDEIPAGAFGCWRAGISETWCAKGDNEMSTAEREAHRARIEDINAARKEEEAERHAEAARRAGEMWNKAQPASPEHPYLVRKGIKPHGLRQLDGRLLVSMWNEAGELVSLQRIGADGEKRFLPGGRKKGCFHLLGDVQGAAALLLAEGFATAASVREATALPVVVAFDAGNLASVASVLRQKYPDVRIVVAADDDAATENNPGKVHAEEAARLVGGVAVLPDFGPSRPDGASDFNDLGALAGLGVVKRQILAVLNTATAAPPAADKWPTPEPIPDGLSPVQPFDFDLLPNAVRGWVFDVAERIQCPPDFPAVAMMVCLSSVIGRKAGIKPKRRDDWLVIPILWGMLIGRPGVMKSPALMAVILFLDRLAAEALKRFEDAVADYEVTRTLKELMRDAAKEKARAHAKKGQEAEAEQELAKALAKSPQGDDDKPPAHRRYKAVDSSVEALGEILMDNPWGTLVYRDELYGLLKSLDREGQEGSRAFYLQGHDGNQDFISDRIGRGKYLRIPAVCFAMLGGIQPGRLKTYVRDAVTGGAGDDGLLQRFGMAVWPDVAGEWVDVDEWPDSAAKKQAFEVFRRLDALPPGRDMETGEEIPQVYRFSTEAQELFAEWRGGLERELRSGALIPAMESHLAKYRKLIPSLALVCALADEETEVSRVSLLRALAWGEYLRTHAERIYAAGLMPDADGARALLGKIRDGKVRDGFSARNVYNNGWAALSEPDAAIKAIGLLCDLGYLRKVETKNPDGGRPTTTYRVHPDFLPRAGA